MTKLKIFSILSLVFFALGNLAIQAMELQSKRESELSTRHKRVRPYEPKTSLTYLKKIKPQEKDNRKLDTIILSQKSSSLMLRQIPSEIIINIGLYLGGSDFRDFRYSCTYLCKTLGSYALFFLPQKDDDLISIINRASINKIDRLISDIGRTPTKLSIPRLRGVLNSFQINFEKDIDQQKSNEELEYLLKNFKGYVKLLNILYSLGDKRSIDLFKQTYEKVQDDLHDNMEPDMEQGGTALTIIHPNLHVFYSECFSLLNPSSRKALSKCYQEGIDPFEKNLSKALYCRSLKLPLTDQVFYQR